MLSVAATLCSLGLVLQPLGSRVPITARTGQQRAAPLAAEGTTDETEWVTTPSGLKYVDLVVGGGDVAESGSVVRVEYTGTLAADGSQFDSTKGRAPFAFSLGAGKVIAGWDEGISGMRIGGKRKLQIPYDLGYGEDGSGAIPPKADLNFDCELISIESGFDAVVSTFPGGLPNVILVTILLLSFIPYFLPPDLVPAFWKVQ
mmetsp:Transcript_56410/g.148126  ORF Transcript_56410/g.148126 Transcript_56410/m.148126 type:complete len:202 (+) Transcript_56410:27-632(+)